MKQEELNKKQVEVMPSLLKLMIANYATINATLDIVIELQSKTDNKPISEIEIEINKKLKLHHESALDLLSTKDSSLKEIVYDLDKSVLDR